MSWPLFFFFFNIAMARRVLGSIPNNDISRYRCFKINQKSLKRNRGHNPTTYKIELLET